jgi:hypothetical protein
MLAGAQAFGGETISEIFAGILRGEPDWVQLPVSTPEGVKRVLRRCLQKDEKLRLRDSRDLRIELQDALQKPEAPSLKEVRTISSAERLAWIAVVAVLVVALAILAVHALRPVPAAPEMSLEITTPSTTDRMSLAISPDGKQIVFVAPSEGRPALWLRSLETGSAAVVGGTEGASFPFWSPAVARSHFLRITS